VTRIGRPPAARKHLREVLAELPDDGTGRVHPALTRLLENLAAMPEPARPRW
jgi:hypothetical protein